MISIITTCKNRLNHLKQSLPALLRQPLTETIVVSYGCDQGTTQWVRENYPHAKLVEVTDDEQFCLARARNIGAKHAKYPLLAFVDADIILNRSLADWVKEPPKERLYFASQPGVWEAGGFVLCSKEAFDVIGGYDEAFRGWGHEDTDLIDRLEAENYRRAPIPYDMLTILHHGDEERQIGWEKGSFATIAQAYYVGDFYRRVKSDVNRLTGQPLALEARLELMSAIRAGFRDAWLNNRNDLVLTCTVDASTDHSRQVRAHRDLVYRLDIGHLQAK